MGQKSACNGNVSYHWILEFFEGIHMDTVDTVAAEKGKSKEQILAWQTRKKLLLISYYI